MNAPAPPFDGATPMEVVGWAKRGPRGKRKTWTVSVTEVSGPSPAAGATSA